MTYCLDSGHCSRNRVRGGFDCTRDSRLYVLNPESDRYRVYRAKTLTLWDAVEVAFTVEVTVTVLGATTYEQAALMTAGAKGTN